MNVLVRLIYTLEFGFVYIAYLSKNKTSTSKTQGTIGAKNIQSSIVFFCEEEDYKVIEISEGRRNFFDLEQRHLTSGELDTNRDYLSLKDLFPNAKCLEYFSERRSLMVDEEELIFDKHIVD